MVLTFKASTGYLDVIGWQTKRDCAGFAAGWESIRAEYGKLVCDQDYDKSAQICVLCKRGRMTKG